MSSLPDDPGHTSRLLNKRLGQPWRFECPECGSTTVEIRKNGRDISPLTYKEGQETTGFVDRWQKDQIHIHDYRCNACNAVFDKPRDKKTGQQTNPKKLSEELRQ